MNPVAKTKINNKKKKYKKQNKKHPEHLNFPIHTLPSRFYNAGADVLAFSPIPGMDYSDPVNDQTAFRFARDFTRALFSSVLLVDRITKFVTFKIFLQAR